MGGWIEPSSFGKESRWYLGHTFRYKLVCGWLNRNDVVTDVGCGCGYGSLVMAPFCAKVIGLDADHGALNLAKSKYSSVNIDYRYCDLAETTQLPECDTAVCFEVIEHIPRRPQEIADLLKIARKHIFLSCPVIPTVGVNPRHLHDFTEDSILQLFQDTEWLLWERVRQGPYQILVISRHTTT